jgi:hypothetical protein
MKRRTINPEFFTDTKTGRLSPTSQILFIGLWCLADREGYVENDPDFIKIQILPYAKSSIKNNLQELVASKLVMTCNYNGKNLLYITNFLKHQPIHPHEAKSPYPPMDSGDVITCNDMSLPPNYNYNYKDNYKSNNTSKKRAKNSDWEIIDEMVDIWNKTCLDLPKAVKSRGDTVRNRRLGKLIGNTTLRDESGDVLFGDMEDWQAYCENIHAADQLCGRVPKFNWKASIDWCIETEHLMKIYEGNYDNNKQEVK